MVYKVGHVSDLLESYVMYWVGSTKASANKDTLIQGYKGKPLNRGVFLPPVLPSDFHHSEISAWAIARLLLWIPRGFIAVDIF